LISARLNYAQHGLHGSEPTKIIAYLLDVMTISI